MANIRTIIIEDDHFNVLAVTKIIQNQFPEIIIVDTASMVNEAIEKINEHQPDLLLMDIHLIGGTSFDVIKQINYRDFKIVFMSAYHEYAVKAIEYAAVDFVFKPFDINDLVVAIDKAIDQMQDKQYALKIKTLFNNIDFELNQIILHGRDSLKAFKISDIVWAQAIAGGAEFHLSDNSSFIATKPLRRYEAILSDHTFFRCHPFNLVNLLHINTIDSTANTIHMLSGATVALENRRYNQLNELLQIQKEYVQTF
ncbi:LytTR family DNA-binding domain-containing protein [Carboxylicivirga sp. M1479]|uniref:LytR/AlgR family response regulator transcription factor n=1 Tax=Carboxylicivirga sp. M1479 TaxID=2594476 RepID=UPI0011778E56|nr:response regulator [Carboxylicivirga sp. M1479]TRX71184.1 response regulator [Carboxylicivirga sp. M1479]